MKKILKNTFVILLVFSSLVLTPKVFGHTYEHYTYEENDNEIIITEYDGTPTNNLVIPEEIEGKKVTIIGDEAFLNCTEIAGGLIIPDTIEQIGASAFKGCTGFNGTLQIPSSVNKIGNNAFDGCINLKNKTIPNTVTDLGKDIFGKHIEVTKISGICNVPYTAKEVKLNIKVVYEDVQLIENKDYEIKYENNIKVGTAKVKIIGKGEFKGKQEFTFKIMHNIANTKVTGIVNKTYTGSKQTQKLTVKYGSKILKNGTDYTVSYKNNVNKGNATVTITGIGKYIGTRNITFKISARSISKLSFSKVKNYTYTGKAICPSVTVKYGKKVLIKNTDYTVTYLKNKNKGTATITIKCKGNYSGTKKITFKISQRKISSVKIDGIVNKTYNKKSQTQSIKLVYNGITLKNKTDYTLSYKNNKNKGTASVTIKGKGNFKGSVKKTFKIKAKDINGLTYSSVKSYTYVGKAIKPNVTIKYGSTVLKSGTNYTIKYSNNTKAGEATITVTGKGNYTGTKKIVFYIKPAEKYYIKVNYKQNVVTVYKQDSKGKFTVPYKAFVCSTGTDTPKSGKYKIALRWSWLKMFGNVYGHYVTQIVGNILFHSVPYFKKDNKTL